MSEGRKRRCPRYEDWITKEKLLLIQGFARRGLTNEQIAENMGISLSTLYRWQGEHTEFSNALKQGKDVADFMMENALFRNGVEGNVTAQIFWLKNRRPDIWRDRHELDAKTILSVDQSAVAEMDELLGLNE